jgi:hypothetical protein
MTHPTQAKKYRAFFNWTKKLYKKGRHLNYPDAATWLNDQGFKSRAGRPYTGGQSVAYFISCVYWYVHNDLGLGRDGARPIAASFTDCNGNFPFGFLR